MLEDIAKLKIRDDRLRQNLGNLDGLANSMDKIGQIHSILVDENWFIRVGTRRHIAASRLGWDQIDVVQRKDLSEDEWLIIEAHENIVRKNLDPVEEAVALSKSKEAYERLHPETVHVTIRGGPGRGHTSEKTAVKLTVVLDESGKETKEVPEPVKSFVTSEAAQQQVSESTIKRKIELGDAIREKKIDKEVIEKVRKKEVSRHAALKKLREARRKLGMENALKAMEEEKKIELPVPDDGMDEFYDEEKSVTEHIPEEVIDALSEFTVGDAEEVDEIVSSINVVRWQLGLEELKMCEDCSKADVLYCPECESGIIVCRKHKTLRLYPLDTEACQDGFDKVS